MKQHESSTGSVGTAAVTRESAARRDPFGVAATVLFGFWAVATCVVALQLMKRPELNREVAALLGWMIEDGAPLRIVVACAWLIAAAFTAIPGLLIGLIGILSRTEDRVSRLSITAMAAHGMTTLPWIAVALGF